MRCHRGSVRPCAAAQLLLLSLMRGAGAQPFSIDSFGAVPDTASYAAAVANGAALAQAIAAANASASLPRQVLVPAGHTYAFLPAVPTFSSVANLTLLLEGTLSAWTTNFTTSWPGYNTSSSWDVLSFSHPCDSITVTSTGGHGTVDGNGYDWWWYTLLGYGDHRPNLLGMFGCSDINVSRTTWRNSPQYHMNARDINRGVFDSVKVVVDLEGQAALLKKAGYWRQPIDGHTGLELDGPALASRLPGHLRHLSNSSGIPTFPLNTDGIDIAGQGVVISNFSCENYDDAVAVKPLRGSPGPGQPTGSVWGFSCTQDITIIHSNVTLGVGMSMGSVPPDPGTNCISNVTIRDVAFTLPIKGIYVKPNPPHGAADTGTGLISNILYQDITMVTPLWWGVWVGTQQQDQPGGGTDTGCSFFYPLPNTTCPADPLVTLANITLRNVSITKPLLSPGILLANASNPGTGFVWDGVVVTDAPSWPVAGGQYLCTNVQGTYSGGTNPVPPCFTAAREEVEVEEADAGHGER